ncbi:glycosyltransferase family 9 protein [Brevundimonas sp.]|uniref:glycosyltransferase family 9 protein n=1 Tax=Brevundimonas sp. TaxID=1871086 RepID=UPI002FC9F388
MTQTDLNTTPASNARPRVLFISPNRIGDSVIASGIVREIDRQWPNASITVVVSGMAAPFYRAAPNVEKIIVVNKDKRGGHWLKLWKAVRATRWDVAIDTRGSATTFLIPTKKRFVYSSKLETGGPKVEVITRLLQAPNLLEPEIYLDNRARIEAGVSIDPQLARGSGHGPIIALAPIAHQKGKSWPADRWAALVEKMKAEPRFDGWRFMLVGGPGDHAPAAPALAAAGDRGIDFVGKGDILASAAAISRATLFVGNDSGLMHVSAAAGTPTLGLFGPTEWWLYGPRGAKTMTVASNNTRGQFAPIEDLTVDAVFAATIKLYDTYAGTP